MVVADVCKSLSVFAAVACTLIVPAKAALAEDRVQETNDVVPAIPLQVLAAVKVLAATPTPKLNVQYPRPVKAPVLLILGSPTVILPAVEVCVFLPIWMVSVPAPVPMFTTEVPVALVPLAMFVVTVLAAVPLFRPIFTA